MSILTARLLARNSLLNLVGQVLPLFVALLALPMVVSGLGTERFGILALAWIVLGYAGEIGFGRATTKYVAELIGRGDTARIPGVVWGSIAIQFALGIVACAALGLAAPFIVQRLLTIPVELHAEATYAFVVLAVGVPVLLVGSCVRGILEAAQRFGVINAVRVPATAALYLLPLAGVLLGIELPGILAMMVATRALAAAAYALVAVRDFPALLAPTVARAELGKLFRFGSWAAVSSLASPALLYLDRIMLGAVVGVAAVGYYAPSFEVALRLCMVPAAIVTTLFPAFSMLSAVHDPARLERLVAQAVKYVLLIVGPVAIVLGVGAHDLLRLWMGAEFADAGGLALRILLLGVLINGLAFIPFTLIQAVDRPDVPAKLHLLQLPAFAILAWFCVRTWGIPGAAVAWTIRVTVDAALLFLAAARLNSFALRGLVHGRVPQTAVMLVGFAAAAALVQSFEVGIAWRVALIVVSLAALAPLLWRYALASADRETIRGLFLAQNTAL